MLEDAIKMYFSCKVFLDNFSVDLNSAGSDVLIDVSPGVVQNMATGKEGSPREVIRGQKFYPHQARRHCAWLLRAL